MDYEMKEILTKLDRAIEEYRPDKDSIINADYKVRVALEYSQLKERYNKLHSMIVKYEAGTIDFKPNCSLELLKKQAAAMGQYLYILEVRAEIENIPLNNSDNSNKQ